MLIVGISLFSRGVSADSQPCGGTFSVSGAATCKGAAGAETIKDPIHAKAPQEPANKGSLTCKGAAGAGKIKNATLAKAPQAPKIEGSLCPSC